MKESEFRLKIKSDCSSYSDLVVDRFDNGSVQINLIHDDRFDAVVLRPEEVQLLIKHLSVPATAPFRG